MVQQQLHFVQVLLRHVRLVQLHVQPRHLQHVAAVRVLADLLATRHLRALRVSRGISTDFAGCHRLLVLHVVPEHFFRLADGSDRFDELQSVKVICSHEAPNARTGVILTADLTHQHGVFHGIDMFFAFHDKTGK